jgi:tryptophan synthase alpha chain
MAMPGKSIGRRGIIGFGISDRETFINTGKYARGGIIGSAFANIPGMDGNMGRNINKFINRIKSE